MKIAFPTHVSPESHPSRHVTEVPHAWGRRPVPADPDRPLVPRYQFPQLALEPLRQFLERLRANEVPVLHDELDAARLEKFDLHLDTLKDLLKSVTHHLKLAGVEVVCDADESKRRLVVHPSHELTLAQLLEGVHLVAVGQEEQLREAVRALHVGVVQLAAVHESQEGLEEGWRRVVNLYSPKL